jgi:hypothetical protein
LIWVFLLLIGVGIRIEGTGSFAMIGVFSVGFRIGAFLAWVGSQRLIDKLRPVFFRARLLKDNIGRLVFGRDIFGMVFGEGF